MKPTVAFIPGVWDLLHIGHVRAINRAKNYGNRLIVGVASDKAVEEDKGQLPIIPEEERAEMVSNLHHVSLAHIYKDLEFISSLERFDPDVLVVGETWGEEQRHIEAEEWIRDNHRRFVKIPYTSKTSTTDIKTRVLQVGPGLTGVPQ